MKKLNIVTIYGGVGSMVIGAAQQGHNILCNIEPRKYFLNPFETDQSIHSTFGKNFNTPYFTSFKEAQENFEFKDLDVVIGHPSCGNFSNIKKQSEKNKVSDADKAAEILRFVHFVRTYKPKFFTMDNLPKSLSVVTAKVWTEALPDYDITFEFISNYHYGNIQHKRDRLFIVGSLKELEYKFQSGEKPYPARTVYDIIQDLPEEDLYDINHIHWKEEWLCRGWRTFQFTNKESDRINPKPITLKFFKEHFTNWPMRKNFQYWNKKGEFKTRIGSFKMNVNKAAPTIRAGGAMGRDNFYRSDTINPLTIRERARIIGAPDSFIFYPMEYMDVYEKTKSDRGYQALMRQTGKFIPPEFCGFIVKQFREHLEGIEYTNVTNQYLAKPNKYVEEAKKYKK